MEKRQPVPQDIPDWMKARVSRRTLGRLAVVFAGGALLSACGPDSIDRQNDNAVESALKVGGQVEVGNCTITIPSGTNIRSTPWVIPDRNDGQSNLIGSVPKDKTYMVEKPFVAHGNSPSGSSGKATYYGYVAGEGVVDWVCSDMTGVATVPGCQDSSGLVTITQIGKKGEVFFDAGGGNVIQAGRRTVVENPKK